MFRDQEHIDLYLKGLLKGEALVAFEKALEEDASFAEIVETQRQIVEGIKLVRQEQLKEYLKQEIDKELIVKPIFSARIYWAVAASLAFLAILYFTLIHNLPDKVQPIVQNTKISENPDTTAIAGAEKDDQNLTPVPPPPTVEEWVSRPPEIVEEIGTNETDYLDDVENIPPVAEIEDAPADVEVKQDKLWAARFYPIKKHESSPVKERAKETSVKVITESTKKEATESENTNKEPEVAKPEEPESTVKVEFWESIVNFKGYSYSGILLKLYGVERTSGISLHAIQGKVYMKMGEHFYYLPVTNEYRSYEKVTDPAILKILQTP